MCSCRPSKRGKLVNDLYLAKFDLLVRVLSHPTSERDYKLLLSLENILEVIDNSEEFIP